MAEGPASVRPSAVRGPPGALSWRRRTRAVSKTRMKKGAPVHFSMRPGLTREEVASVFLRWFGLLGQSMAISHLLKERSDLGQVAVNYAGRWFAFTPSFMEEGGQGRCFYKMTFVCRGGDLCMRASRGAFLPQSYNQKPPCTPSATSVVRAS